MVDSSGLENRHSLEQRTIEGSNPSLSFYSLNRFLSSFYLFRLARLGGIAEPEKKIAKDNINGLKKKGGILFFFFSMI